MKKTVFVILALFIVSNSSSYALDTALIDMRNKIFEESKELKSLLANSKDVVLVNSMWDSCIVALTQLDAYFSMVGIFNTIKKEDLSGDSVNYLINWLNGIKKTNELNVKSLNDISITIEPRTKVYLLKLREYFSELNNQVNADLEKVSLLKESLKAGRIKDK